ncbi:MAG: YabP/YqfC family sporulation protein [Oscillospiraceae bacterium]|nr:YabP/YqfC family sporulation protein [Oscillospiraceae bacterium]
MYKETRGDYRRVLSKFIKKKLYLNTHMNLTDNTFLEIENVKRITDYNDVCIQLQTSTLSLRIWGSNLQISDYNTDGIVVRGAFSSIEFFPI